MKKKEKKLKHRFMLFGQPKEFFAYKGKFISELIKACPQLKKMKLSDIKPIIIE